MDWYRWWHGSSTDPKFQMVAIECGMPLSCVLGLWAVLLEKASESNPRGSFQIDHEVLSFQLGIDTVTPCNAMQRRGLLHVTDVTLHIVSWEKRQPKRERNDDSSERVRSWRERQKQNVTPCNANETQETPRLDKRREEKYIYTPPIGDVLLAQWKTVRKAKRVGPITELVFRGIEREAKKAGITPEQAITICCEKGWASFDSSWNWKSAASDDRPIGGNSV